ncbi:hypothetical protein Nekkels1_7 [Cellulophaga phage Nekkels_1]|uniref:Uncharacterized protein n=1 Tax=Cellulophaga phage Nekkels_1 TaxID=2745692 RepID=A0A8E4UXJ3_9CAUD|nr:hypothetical protein M1M31_gp07 [Cellulophaga phage Nekkels_1]QQO97074.1 hypothetical protein Nekkels1_7 [Cellulophaga phage Nekkels_1]QQO97167.1 hypothetical protein Nekkels2_7 [Cellulophaga phage Nekkels_2]
MKTAIQHFREVQDDELRIRLLANLRDYPINKTSSTSVHKTLFDAFQSFKWGETGQGYGYWESKSNEIRLKGLPTAKDETKGYFKDITDSISSLLDYKNEKYGNSALEPINVFDGKCKSGKRIDDKISRVKNNEVIQKNDVADLIGYLILTCKEFGWTNFDEFKD